MKVMAEVSMIHDDDDDDDDNDVMMMIMMMIIIIETMIYIKKHKITGRMI